MLVKVVGMTRFDGTFEGKEYHQSKLHCIEQDYQADDLLGYRVSIVTVKDSINPPPLEIGAEYLIYFGQPNKSGKASVEYIRKNDSNTDLGKGGKS